MTHQLEKAALRNWLQVKYFLSLNLKLYEVIWLSCHYFVRSRYGVSGAKRKANKG